MSARLRRNYQIAVIILIIAMVTCFYVQYLTIAAYNEKPHVSTGPSDAADCSAVIVQRGDDTSSWYKQDTGLTGQIYDATVSNKTPEMVSSWTMTINIQGSCYLNQFWNGQVEIHQHTSRGDEVVQTLTLADYDQSALKVSYRMDGSDLLIPLEKGDYIVYYPSEKFSEMPLDASSQTVVGMIVYYQDGVDLSDYRVDYFCHREFTDGPAFVLLVLIGILLALVLITYHIVQHAYRQAEKALELRKSGLSCMSELYAVIYLIDLVANTIVPVGVSDEDDSIRPKKLSPADQLRHLLKIDAEDFYQELAAEFIDLDTLRERMAERNDIAFEYKSRSYGWCRLRFIAMDRDKNDGLEKVLFTIEQINEEKQELGEILEQVMVAKSATEEQGELLGSMSRELERSFATLTVLNERILRESTEKNIRGYAAELYDAGAMMRWLMDNIGDYSQIQAGNVELTPSEYVLGDLVLEAQSMAEPLLRREGLTLETEMTESLPRGLYGDGPKLRQVIANLLVHAGVSEDVANVKLSVYGKAADEHNLHLLFSVTTSHAKESGASIALARAMLALMGSELNITDAYGGGKNIYFEIEQQIVDATPTGPLGVDDAGRSGC